MEFCNLSVKEFCDKVAEKSPVPGGGAVGAVVASLAASLNQMVANLTIGKKKYEDYEGIMQDVLEQMNYLRDKLLDLVTEDVKAFNSVMESFKLPKEDPQRDDKIKKTLKKATEVPLELVRVSRDILKSSENTARFGNKNAVSDAYSAAELAFASASIGKYNVIINLKALDDEEYKRKIVDELNEAFNEAKVYYDRIKELIKENGFNTI